MLRHRFQPHGFRFEWFAGFATALWLGLVAALMLRAGFDQASVTGQFAFVMALVLPPGLLWLAVALLRALHVARRDLATLHESVAALRSAWLAHDAAGARPVLVRADQAPALPATGHAVFATRRGVTAPAGPAPDQPGLALVSDTRVTAAPLEAEDLIRALHFPEDGDDSQGFAALHRALADYPTALLIRSAQTVLTALAEEGIYMDDLRPDRARPDMWRAFAEGARGASVAGLGGVRDRSCLALSAGRMRQDAAFRDAAHRFLREFDRCLRRHMPTLSDAELARLVETRSARAFMLLGRVSGVFGR